MAANQNRERLREAAQFIKQGDHKSAQAIFRELIKASPRDAELWYLYSFAVTQRDHQIKSLEKALTIVPDHEKTKKRLAQLRAEAPVQPAAPRKSNVPYGLLAVVVVTLGTIVLLLGFMQSRFPQSAALLATATPSPTATVSTATRTPTSTSTPTRTPTPTPTQEGGGTGAILVYESTLKTFVLLDLHGNKIGELALPEGVTQASWTRDGRHLLVRQTVNGISCVESTSGSAKRECVGLADAQNPSSVTMMPIGESFLAFDLSPDGSLLAFAGLDEQHNWQIWLEHADGTDAHQITTIPEGIDPNDVQWTPDGRYITYVSQKGIHLIRPDGTENHLMVVRGMNPDWSVDGLMLTYVMAEDGGSHHIYIINAAGTERRKLTYTDFTDNHKYTPKWSPDGRHIIYKDSGNLLIMNADGTEQQSIAEGQFGSLSWQPLPAAAPMATYTPAPTSTPSATFTPKPALIPTAVPASDSTVGGSTGRILYSANSKGRLVFRTVDLNDQSISEETFSEDVGSVQWLPDGQRYLVNMSRRDGCTLLEATCLAFMNADTHEMLSLVTLPFMQTYAVSPDMNQIVYVDLDPNRDRQVFVMNLDGTNVRQLTHYGANGLEGSVAASFAWSPDSRFIAYSVDFGDGSPIPPRLDRVSRVGSDEAIFIEAARKPVWSPDGTSLLYTSLADPSKQTLMAANADGTNPRPLFFGGDTEMSYIDPVWSPDSRLIALVYYVYGEETTLYTVDVESRVATVIVKGDSPGAPSWQPLPSSVDTTIAPTATPVPLDPTLPPLIHGPNDFTVPSGTGHVTAKLVSPLGDYIGGGRGTVYLEGEGSLKTGGWYVMITLEEEDGTWRFAFFAPYLEVGKTYEGADRLPVSSHRPGMEVNAPGKGCNTLLGDFTVEQITPEVVITFSQACSQNPALTGTLTFRPD